MDVGTDTRLTAYKEGNEQIVSDSLHFRTASGFRDRKLRLSPEVVRAIDGIGTEGLGLCTEAS